MTLGDFKKHIERFPIGTQFKFGISEPFSWRGVYAEVAFAITENPMTREEVLAKIRLAYRGTFFGYKGGEYSYDDDTDVHFEPDSKTWTDGGYVSGWIARIENQEEYKTQEHRLVKLAF
jgi:hypothetical protein